MSDMAASVPAPGGSAASSRVAIQADLLDFPTSPHFGEVAAADARWRPNHWLLVQDGRIAAVQPEAPDAAMWPHHRHPGRLLMPGFIDTHVHSAQLEVLGSWGTQLLDWLNDYTFPAESALADDALAAQSAARFTRALWAHGTTAAAVFPTVHASSCDALFAAAATQNMRLITGKVLMDRHAPAALCDGADLGERASVDLIQRWHGKGRASYAITPRFAPTSSDAQLRLAGELLRSAPGLYMQTHVAENPAEVAWVAELFPQARSYLDVYERNGLLNERAILAHGIWLDEADRAQLHEHGAQIAFCPSSNLFLGSGLFGWRQARAAGVAVSLASDVGGGTHLSMRRTLGDAYKVQAMAQCKVTAFDLLHAATHGAAEALGLAQEVGSLEPGAAADVCIWDLARTEVAQRRQEVARSLHEKLFAWLMAGDEDDLAETWVYGVRRYARDTACG